MERKDSTAEWQLLKIIEGKKGAKDGLDPGKSLPIARRKRFSFSPEVLKGKAAFLQESLRSMIKAYFVFGPISFIIGFLTVQAFWMMAPIPSGIYPVTEIRWPVQAYNQLLWVKRPPGYFRLTWIIGGFLITAILDIAFTFFNAPISMIAFAAGTSATPAVTFTILLGGLASKFFFPRLFGERWSKTKYLVSGGFMVGLASMITLGAAMGLIMKSLWPLPY